MIVQITQDIINTLKENGAKFKVKTVNQKKKDPEIDSATKKAKRLKKKIAKTPRGVKRDEIIFELENTFTEISQLNDQKVEREERRKFEAAPTNTDGIFEYIKNFKRASSEIGPIKHAKGNIIFKEDKKSEAFADY